MTSKRSLSKTRRTPQSAPRSTAPDGQLVDGQPLQVTTTTHQVFSGPLPPPAVLEGYERALPGSAGKILEMATREQQHRHSVEAAAVNANIEAQQGQIAVARLQTKSAFRSDLVGQVFGFIALLLCLAAAFYFGLQADWFMASLFLGPAVLGIVQALVSARRAGESMSKK